MPRKDHLPRQTRQEHITLQPNRSIEFRVEQIEKRKKLPLERQQIAVGHFLMKLHHRKQKTPELADIFLHFRIRTVVVNREPEL